jgi:hypothetical protein
MNKLIELSGELRAMAIMAACRECIAAGERVIPATLKARLPDERFPNFGDVGRHWPELQRLAFDHIKALEAAPALHNWRKARPARQPCGG